MGPRQQRHRPAPGPPRGRIGTGGHTPASAAATTPAPASSAATTPAATTPAPASSAATTPTASTAAPAATTAASESVGRDVQLLRAEYVWLLVACYMLDHSRHLEHH